MLGGFSYGFQNIDDTALQKGAFKQSMLKTNTKSPPERTTTLLLNFA